MSIRHWPNGAGSLLFLIDQVIRLHRTDPSPARISDGPPDFDFALYRWVRDTFLRCAIQRLLQALGAYGVIGILRGKPEFLRHVSPAIKSLRQVASMIPSFKFFTDFLNELPDTIRMPFVC
jgi:hypothetical protein